MERSKGWKLVLAPKKETVHFCMGSSDNILSYNFEGSPTAKSHKVRNLGLSRNDKLESGEHYEGISRKSIWHTFQIFKGLTTNNKNALIFADSTNLRKFTVGTTIFSPKKQGM